MSLAIDVDKVTEVLLADGWHGVRDGSFTLDSYEYIWEDGGPDRDPMVLLGGGQVAGVPSTGFGFKEAGGWTYGPLTAVLAVRVRRGEA